MRRFASESQNKNALLKKKKLKTRFIGFGNFFEKNA
jgi:hypothetical protein